MLKPQSAEATALGAAFLAGLAVGFWQDKAEITALRKITAQYDPTMEEAVRAQNLAGWAQAVRRCRGEL